jgi:hypothetical protein
MIKYVFNDGTYQVNYGTNGTSKPHLSMKEFDLLAKEAIINHRLNYSNV